MGVDKLLGADTHVIVLEAVVAETAVTLVKVDHLLFLFLDLHLTRIYAELRGKYNMPKLGNQNVRNILCTEVIYACLISWLLTKALWQ